MRTYLLFPVGCLASALAFALLLFFASSTAVAQTPTVYGIGHAEKHYIDASRGNRDVWTEVYFPTGADTSVVAAGTFPTIVFGHGFIMAWSVYDYLWKYFVPRGYVCVFPRTEGNVSPNHTNFGGDLRYLSNLFGTVLNTQSGGNNKLVGHLTTKTAIMGHSMGGGASFLAAANNTQLTTMVTMAAAQTSPRSSQAAKSVSVPNLVLAGEQDCVAPPATNQAQMFDSLPASLTKYFVTLKNGSHCNFASQGSVCEFGQVGTCGSLARTTQNSRLLTLASPWLDFYLRDDCAAWHTFRDSLTVGLGQNKYNERHANAVALPVVTILQSANQLSASVQNVTAIVWSTGETTTSITPTQTSTYTVTVSGVNGCTTSASAHFPYLAANDLKAFASVQLFPNPANGSTVYLNFELTNPRRLEVRITDTYGRTVIAPTVQPIATHHNLQIDVTALPKGIYFVTATTDDGTWTGRWMKL